MTDDIPHRKGLAFAQAARELAAKSTPEDALRWSRGEATEAEQAAFYARAAEIAAAEETAAHDALIRAVRLARMEHQRRPAKCRVCFGAGLAAVTRAGQRNVEPCRCTRSR